MGIVVGLWALRFRALKGLGSRFGDLRFRAPGFEALGFRALVFVV